MGMTNRMGRMNMTSILGRMDMTNRMSMTSITSLWTVCWLGWIQVHACLVWQVYWQWVGWIWWIGWVWQVDENFDFIRRRLFSKVHFLMLVTYPVGHWGIVSSRLQWSREDGAQIGWYKSYHFSSIFNNRAGRLFGMSTAALSYPVWYSKF